MSNPLLPGHTVGLSFEQGPRERCVGNVRADEVVDALGTGLLRGTYIGASIAVPQLSVCVALEAA